MTAAMTPYLPAPATDITHEDDHDHEHKDESDDDHEHSDESDHGHSHGEGDDHSHGDPNQSLTEALIPVWVGLLGGFIFAGGFNVWQRDKFSLWGYLGLFLIGITAVVHLVGGLIWSSTLLVLNGLGYFGLGAAWLMPFTLIPHQKRLISLALIGYTLVTIVGYFATHSTFDALGIVTKAVEILLLIVIGLVMWGQRNG